MAGLDAGHAYNTFPLMGGRLVPEEYSALPGWRNAFENTAAVQFHHRVLALSTLASVTALWAAHRRAPLPAASRSWLNGLLAVTAAQVGGQCLRLLENDAGNNESMFPVHASSEILNSGGCIALRFSCLAGEKLACITHCTTSASKSQVTLGVTTLLTYAPLGTAHHALG